MKPGKMEKFVSDLAGPATGRANVCPAKAVRRAYAVPPLAFAPFARNPACAAASRAIATLNGEQLT